MLEVHRLLQALLVLVAVLSAPWLAAQTQTLSGTWTERFVLGAGPSPWGSPVRTAHDAGRFSVIGPDGVWSFTLDGSPRDTPIAESACATTLRRTTRIVITESIVIRARGTVRSHSPCLFDDQEEAGVSSGIGSARGSVRLDTVTAVSREGDRLVVEVTRRDSAGPRATTVVYEERTTPK